MIVVSRCESRNPALQPPPVPARVVGAPCVFKGSRGAFHVGAGPIGVVFCAPWGLEERVTRAAWRDLAEEVAGLGVPALTFDYPGTGDSLGAMDGIEDIARWVDAIGEGADFLRAYSGVKRFVLIGQSLGAALAMQAAAARTDVAGLILIAPVASGRAYLRDLLGPAASAAAMVPAARPGAVLARHGFVLSAAATASLSAFDPLRAGSGGVAGAVILDRADRKAGAEVLEHFKRNGVPVAFEAIASPRLDLSARASIQPLPAPREAIRAALARFLPASASAMASRVAPRVPLLPATLRGESFKEEPVVLGRAAGMLCHPARPCLGAPAVVILEGGATPAPGWRRASVEAARDLAAAGLTSLRVADRGLDDAAAWDERVVEAEAAITLLAERGHAAITLAGSGHGATLALALAAWDPRVGAVIAADTPAWIPDTSAATDRGLLASVRRRLRRLGAGLPIWVRALVLRDGTPAAVRRLFADLARRGTPVTLAHDADDRALGELRACHRGRPAPRGCRIVILPAVERKATWLLHPLGVEAMETPAPVQKVERRAA